MGKDHSMAILLSKLVWIQLLRCIFYCLVKSNPVNLETIQKVILTPTPINPLLSIRKHF